MARLIAFDQQTASTLVARTRTAAQIGHGSPLKAALATEDTATLLMPGTNPEEMLVVSVKKLPKRVIAAPPQMSMPAMPPPALERAAPPPVFKRTPPSEPPVASKPAATQVSKPEKKDHNEPVAYEATGFLGLEDSPLYEEDLAPKPPKKWWQKLLE